MPVKISHSCWHTIRNTFFDYKFFLQALEKLEDFEIDSILPPSVPGIIPGTTIYIIGDLEILNTS